MSFCDRCGMPADPKRSDDLCWLCGHEEDRYAGMTREEMAEDIRAIDESFALGLMEDRE